MLRECLLLSLILQFTADLCFFDLKRAKSLLSTSATNCCRHKRVGGIKNREKRAPWWNQEVKEAICAKKVADKTWLSNTSPPVELRFQYS